jgi:hypothetical protein
MCQFHFKQCLTRGKVTKHDFTANIFVYLNAAFPAATAKRIFTFAEKFPGQFLAIP